MSRDAASTVTLALLLIFDSFVMYWIFTAIVDTRRTLRLRKNYVKLAMYNHFAYTLIFAIVASLGFIVWELVTLNFPAGNCLTVSVCDVREREKERDWGERGEGGKQGKGERERRGREEGEGERETERER